MSKMQPMETAPKDMPVLVKHRVYGWIEAVCAQYETGTDKFGWGSPGLYSWLPHKDMLAWAELPEEDK